MSFLPPSFIWKLLWQLVLLVLELYSNNPFGIVEPICRLYGDVTMTSASNLPIFSPFFATFASFSSCERSMEASAFRTVRTTTMPACHNAEIDRLERWKCPFHDLGRRAVFILGCPFAPFNRGISIYFSRYPGVRPQ